MCLKMFPSPSKANKSFPMLLKEVEEANLQSICTEELFEAYLIELEQIFCLQPSRKKTEGWN